MSEWIRSVLDIILTLTVATGLIQVGRLIRSLADLRSGRMEMERFVREFNATVVRAEAGIKGLRQAARETGDDLERLVEKGSLLRDELHFLVESADQLAERLATAATNAARGEPKTPEFVKHADAAATDGKRADTKAESPPTADSSAKSSQQPVSRAEKELIQALRKLN
jgi:hypothetical protein